MRKDNPKRIVGVNIHIMLIVFRNARIGIIVGVVIGVVFIIAVVMVIYFYCRRKQSLAETEKMKTAARILGVDSEVSILKSNDIFTSINASC